MKSRSTPRSGKGVISRNLRDCPTTLCENRTTTTIDTTDLYASSGHTNFLICASGLCRSASSQDRSFLWIDCSSIGCCYTCSSLAYNLRVIGNQKVADYEALSDRTRSLLMGIIHHVLEGKHAKDLLMITSSLKDLNLLECTDSASPDMGTCHASVTTVSRDRQRRYYRITGHHLSSEASTRTSRFDGTLPVARCASNPCMPSTFQLY